MREDNYGYLQGGGFGLDGQEKSGGAHGKPEERSTGSRGSCTKGLSG